MNKNTIIKSLLLAAATYGLTAVVRADEPLPASGTMGLLGQTYAGLSYSYVNLDDAPVNADNYGFQYNQSLNTGLDAVFSYDYTKTGLFAGDRAKQQLLGAGLRAFSSSYSWGKPYVEAGVGYAWIKYAGVKETSYFWDVAVGVEFQVLPAATVTPYVQYMDAPDFSNGGVWNYGVKANYWVSKQWSVTAGVSRNDDQDMTYSVGMNFRF